MVHPLSAKHPSFPQFEWRPLLAGALLLVAAFVAYANSLGAPFVFDDHRAIVENRTIRQLWPLTGVLSPPADQGGVTGRPLINLSLALNYAVGGTAVRGYHLANIAVHALAALVLFGVIRRTLLRVDATIPGQGQANGPRSRAAARLAFVSTLWWTLHPLQTETVTGIVQRTESIAALFYLLTFYFFLRGVETPQPSRWFIGCVAACLAGMASKETMVTAPVAVLLYDRTFVAGSFAAAWRLRRALYASLAGTWLLLAALVLGSPQRAGTVGFGLEVSSWEYLLTQCRAIGLYLQLALWPHPLVVDYGTAVVKNVADVLLPGALVSLLLIGTVVALWRRPRWGFAGGMFFLLLAPSSSFIPLASQTIAEHRMYLPLAVVLACLVIGSHRVLGRSGLGALLVAALPAFVLTSQRNRVYASELSLWSQTVAAQPDNARARINLGHALVEANRLPEAIAQFELASRLGSFSASGHINLASAYLSLNDAAQALPHAELAVRSAPRAAAARINLGLALSALGRAAEAVPQFEEALRLEPPTAEVHANLARALLQANRTVEAVEQLNIAANLAPEDAGTWCDLGRAYLRQRDLPAARRAGAHALHLAPDSPLANLLMGNLELAEENSAAAIARFRRALELDATLVAARNNLANTLLLSGEVDEAIAEYRRVLGERPDDRLVQENLSHALELQSRNGARPSPPPSPFRANTPPTRTDPVSPMSPVRPPE